MAAISYYFGDKPGLYKAVFFGASGMPAGAAVSPRALSRLSLPQVLCGLFAGLIEPLRRGEVARLEIKLRMREMFEPTGLWEQEIAEGIRPMHEALVATLCRHLGLRRADDDVQRLAICVAGLGVHLHVGHDVTDALAPRLNSMPDAIDLWLDRLVMYAQAMVESERRRRAAAKKSPSR